MLETVISLKDIEKAKKDNKPIHVECPYCQAQYLMGEIFLPGAIIGRPTEVTKDAFGKIIYVDYRKADNMPSEKETFVCEYCDQPFDVELGYIPRKTKKSDPATNFKQEYVPLTDDQDSSKSQ